MSSSDKKVNELLTQLNEIVEQLGWVVGMPMMEEGEENVPGLIIGERAFVKSLLKEINTEIIDEGQELDVVDNAKEFDNDDDEHEILHKKKTFH